MNRINFLGLRFAGVNHSNDYSNAPAEPLPNEIIMIISKEIRVAACTVQHQNVGEGDDSSGYSAHHRQLAWLMLTVEIALIDW